MTGALAFTASIPAHSYDRLRWRHHELPASVHPAGSRPCRAAQSHSDGLDAHRARRQGPRLRQAGGLFRGTGTRWRGPDGHRRHRPQHRRVAQALRWSTHPALAQTAASQAHHRRARRRRAYLPADPARRPLRLSPAVSGAVETQVTDHAVHPARAVVARRRAHHRRLRPLRTAGAGSRLRRRGSDGFGRLSDQPVHRRTHQPPQRCLGRRCRAADAAADRNRAPHARSGRSRLHHHLSPVDARPGRGRPAVG